MGGPSGRRNGRWRHGETKDIYGRKIWSPEYICWKNMRARVNSDNPRYRHLTIDPRWETDFSNFLEDMGRRPGPEYSIDRIKNDEGYYKRNCRWATRTTQNRNRSMVRLSMEKAEEIRKRRKMGITRKLLSKQFGVTKNDIDRVTNGEIWREE